MIRDTSKYSLAALPLDERGKLISVIPCTGRTPILHKIYLEEKCGLYTCEYGRPSMPGSCPPILKVADRIPGTLLVVIFHSVTNLCWRTSRNLTKQTTCWGISCCNKLRQGSTEKKIEPEVFKFVICNHGKFSLSPTFLVSACFIIIAPACVYFMPE